MIEALFSFLGGSAFRMIWGEVVAWGNKKLDHEQEMARMQLQAELDDKSHQRNMEALRLQNELGIKTIEAKAEADVSTAEADAFDEAMKTAFKPTGITIVDVWNGIIRPSAATLALVLWFLKLDSQHFVMTDWDYALVGTILGFFFASRELAKRGK
jgi:hypothetical protein